MTTIKAMKELARASKQTNNNPNVRIQVAERKDGKGFNTYRCYGNEYFPDGEDETTIGFISEPLTYKEVEDWLFLKVDFDYCYPSDFGFSSEKVLEVDDASPESEVVGAIPEPDEQPNNQNLEQTINQPKVFNFRFEQSGNGTQIGYVEHFHGKKED